MFDHKMIGTEYFHNKITNIEGELKHLRDYLKKLEQELQLNFRKFWMLDERFGDIIQNINNSVETLSRKSQYKFIMRENYRFPPIILRRIELFGIEALTIGELEIIKEANIIAYIECLINEKFTSQCGIDHTEMKIKTKAEEYMFYYKRVSWYGFRKTSPNKEIIHNVKTTNTLFEIIHTSLSTKYRRSGLLIMPEIEVEIVKY